jgi:serine/threonine protein kinase
LKWGWHVAEAVAYIHIKRVIHCDIGPGNLLLDKDLNVRVSDFQGRLLYPDRTVCLVSQFKTKQFPALDDVRGGDVVKKCWAGEYELADEVVHDLE